MRGVCARQLTRAKCLAGLEQDKFAQIRTHTYTHMTLTENILSASARDEGWEVRQVSSHLMSSRAVLMPVTSMLQCVAVCCSVLQCVAVCRNVLQLLVEPLGIVESHVDACDECVAVCCSVLQYVAIISGATWYRREPC